MRGRHGSGPCPHLSRPDDDPAPGMLVGNRPSSDGRTPSVFSDEARERVLHSPSERSPDKQKGQAMIPTERFEQVEVASAEALRDWLAAHHGQEESVWLVRWLKGAGARSVPIDAILDELLCWGWVDGLARKFDAERTLRLASPRRHQRWTRTYKERAARLIAEGRMQPSGYAAIAEAKRTGGWDELDHVDDLLEPPDLAAALDAVPAARKWWDASAPSYRRNVLRWLALARTPATRGTRVARTAQLSARGEKVPQM